jgi:predicted ATP-grasp superfamily ATP-dependent carboligase
MNREAQKKAVRDENADRRKTVAGRTVEITDEDETIVMEFIPVDAAPALR